MTRPEIVTFWVVEGATFTTQSAAEEYADLMERRDRIVELLEADSNLPLEDCKTAAQHIVRNWNKLKLILEPVPTTRAVTGEAQAAKGKRK